MLILITVLLLVLTALALLVIRAIQPGFRFFWLIAVSGALLAWLSTWIWLARLPLLFELPSWQPANLFADSPTFLADGISWPFAIGLTTLALAILLTAVVRQDLTDPLPWAGTLTLTGLGVLAVTSNSTLTLILVWAALDLAELISQLGSMDTPSASERVVIGFSTRVAGIGLAVWANVISVANGGRMDFTSMPPQAGLFLLVAAGLRLGVLPLHLPYSAESNMRRGVGTAIRLVSAASSLILLARIPSSSVISPLTPYLFILTSVAAIYGGWMWLRAPDDLAGRPFWVIGLASLAMAAALRADSVGAAGWGVALILTGGALFLASVQHVWINRALLIAVFGLSSLPFSLTAGTWSNNTPTFFLAWPFLLVAQAMLIAGFIRHSLRPGVRENIESQPRWTRNVYPTGIGLLLVTLLALGVVGWDGARQIGNIFTALIASLLTFGLVWATPRLPFLNPIRAHWARPSANSRLENLYGGLWAFYQTLGRLSAAISATLEGEGGIMWSLLFLAIFISFMSQAKP
jgi:hypothetical protein